MDKIQNRKIIGGNYFELKSQNLKAVIESFLEKLQTNIYPSGGVANSISLTGFAYMKLCNVIIILSVLFRDIYLYSKLPISLVN